MTKGKLRFFFDYAAACLWADDVITRDQLGVGPIDCCLPLSAAAHALIEEVGFEQSGYLNPIYPPDPSLWTQDLCNRFNAKVERLLCLIQEELGELYDIQDRQIRYVQDPGLEAYLTRNPELSAISQVDEAVIRRLWGEPRVMPSGEVIQSLPRAKVAPVKTLDELLVEEIIARSSRLH
jgi:hypothetical protein